MSEFDEKAYLKAGTVTSTHGLKGEVKVFPLVDDSGRFSLFTSVFLRGKGRSFAVEIEGVKFFKKMVILKLKGFDRIEDVTAFRGLDLYALRNEIAELKENQYFDEDLMGIEVFDKEGSFLGKLESVLHSPGNDVYTVKTGEGEEILLPAVRKFILSVDIENGRMVTDPLPGMLPKNRGKE